MRGEGEKSGGGREAWSGQNRDVCVLPCLKPTINSHGERVDLAADLQDAGRRRKRRKAGPLPSLSPPH